MGSRYAKTSPALAAASLLIVVCCVSIAAKNAASQAVDANESVLVQEAQSLQAVCGSKCHTLALVMDAPKSYEVWHDTVQAMLDRGASGTDDQLQDIMDYLHQTVTTIDVNHADAEELEIVLGLSPEQVRSIVKRRQQRAFKSLDDLKTVPEIDSRRLDEKARLILYQ